MSADGTIRVLADAASALERLGLTDGERVIGAERAAWLVFVLREVPDSEDAFPHGKWATIQAIEAQVVENAKADAAEQRGKEKA